MRKGLGYNWTDGKTNTEILNELKIASVIQKRMYSYINQTGQTM